MKEYLKKLHKYQQEILDEIDKICKENNLNYFLIGGTLLGAVRHQGFIPWDDDIDIAMPRKDYEKFIHLCKSNLDSKFELDCIKTNKKYWLPFIKIRRNGTIHEEKALEEYDGNKGIWLDIFPLDEFSDKDNLIKRENKIKKLKILLQCKNIRKTKEYNSVYKKIILILIKILPNRFLHLLINKCMMSKQEGEYFVNFGSQYGIKKQTHLKDKYFPAIDVEFEGKMYKAPRDYDYVLTKIYGKNYMELPPIEKRVTHNPIRIKFENEPEINFEK